MAVSDCEKPWGIIKSSITKIGYRIVARMG